MKTAILTGGTGFLGNWLLKELVKNEVFVYVIVRRNSKRLSRLSGISGIKIIEMNMDEISLLHEFVEKADVFYHLAWEGDRNDFSKQMKNIQWAVNAMEAAGQMKVKQFVVTGSQAEYGPFDQEIDENFFANPNTAYGACKLACYYILKTLSEQIELPLTWIRVFSVYGEGDNSNTLISYLFKCFQNGETPKVTSGEQHWDYLYAEDAARAIYLLGEKSKYGLFNLAYGGNKPLREFIIELRNLISPNSDIYFDSMQNLKAIELMANVNKIKNEIQWEPLVNFSEGILRIKENLD